MISFISNLFSKIIKAKQTASVVVSSSIEIPKVVSPPKVEAQNSSSNEKLIAFVLEKLSYNISNIQQAIKQFQQDQGMKSDGIVGPQTLARIRFYDEKFKSAPALLKQMRRFRVTHYYVAAEEDYPIDNCIPVYTIDGNVLCNINAAFFCNAALEGTGKLKNGTLINVSGKPYAKVNSEIYKPAAAVYEKHIAYMTSKGRTPRPSGYFGIEYKDGKVISAQTFHIVEKFGKGFGVGKKNIPYEICKTVATDQGLYATSEPRFKGKGGVWTAGTKGWLIDIAEENGHDGWVTAADVGGGIFGAHFDFFTGTKQHVNDVPLRSNSVTYVWFEGIEEKLPQDYEYGLFDRK